MSSLKSRLVIFMLSHRHWFRLQRKRRESVGWDMPVAEFRKDVERGAGLFGKLPDNIDVKPVTIGNLYAEWITPAQAPQNKAILYFHGGGYVSGTCLAHRTHVAKFVHGSGIRALVFEYRLAPENPFPAALDDALEAYSWMLSQGIASTDIVFMGDSAGGGLVLATLIALRDKGMPLPSASVTLSPWTDLKCTGESLTRNAKVDPLTPRDSWTVFSHYYVADHDPSNPWISPLYGDLRGLPPMLIYAGGHELLLDDSTRFAEKAKADGVEVRLHVGEGMFHCYPVCGSLFPESQQAMNDICDYVRTRLVQRPEPVGTR